MKRELLQDKLAAKIIEGIRCGQYPVGSLLPKELELVESEKLSRFTVRAAMKKLEVNGFIRRTPHVGTRVISTGKGKSFDQQLSSFSDLDRLASHNPREILDVREFVVSKELAPKIGYPPGETLIRFSMVRQGAKPEDPPIAWTSEYVDRRWQKLVVEAPKHPDLLMIELACREFHKKCVEVRQTVEATLLTDEAAKNLKAKTGTPALRIFRRYIDDHGHLILTTVSYHPADRYAFNLDVKLDPEKLS